MTPVLPMFESWSLSIDADTITNKVRLTFPTYSKSTPEEQAKWIAGQAEECFRSNSDLRYLRLTVRGDKEISIYNKVYKPHTLGGLVYLNFEKRAFSYSPHNAITPGAISKIKTMLASNITFDYLENIYTQSLKEANERSLATIFEAAEDARVLAESLRLAYYKVRAKYPEPLPKAETVEEILYV